jgi:hypothetical protein
MLSTLSGSLCRHAIELELKVTIAWSD